MPTIVCGGQTKGSSLDGTVAIKNTRFGIAAKQYVEVYEVLADNASQTEDDILNTPGLPLLWLYQRNAYCISRQAAEVNTQALLWEVTCQFDSEINPENANNTDPTSAAPQWTWGQEFEQRLMQVDVDGTPIRSTAGETIPYEVPNVIPILTITRYQNFFNANDIINYCNHVNETTFWGVPPGSVLCSGINDQQESINGANYRRVTYTFKVRVDYLTGTLQPDGWNVSLLNEGSYYLLYEDEAGNPVSPGVGFEYDEIFRRKFTDGDRKGATIGNLKSDGTANWSDEPADLVYLPFKIYKDAEFNALNLGPW